MPIASGAARRFGSMMHEGLAEWFIAHEKLDSSMRLAAAMNAIQHYWNEGDAKDLFELVAAEELMRAYDARWFDVEMTVLAVEREFEMKLINPATRTASRTWRLGGKIDALIEMVVMGVRRRLLVEHKTTTLDISPGSAYWPHLRIDSQIDMYWDGCASMGWEIDGCVYDVLGKPNLSPYKETPDAMKKFTKGKLCKLCKAKKLVPVCDDRGKPQDVITGPEGESVATGVLECKICSGTCYEEPPHLYSNQRSRDETSEEFRLRIRAALTANPENYLQRGDVTRLDDELNEHRAEQWLTAKTMSKYRKLGIHPKHSQNCRQWNRLCDYHPICVGDVQKEDRGQYEHRRAHAELSNPSQEKPA